MDWIAVLTSSEGRLAPQRFWFALLALYFASIASQWLLTGDVAARSGVWPFTLAQAGILWSWTVVHIKRLRDAGRPATGAIAVATLYGLSVGLIVLLALVIDTSATAGELSSQSLAAFALLAGLLLLLFNVDLGPFSYILKALALIACLPFAISLAFSLYTGLGRSVP